MRLPPTVRSFVFAAVLVLAMGGGRAHAQMEMPPQSLGAVIEQAEAQETPILLDIYAPWCPYCQKMQETVYADSTVRATLERQFTYARLNRDTTAGAHQFEGRTLSSKQLGLALGARGVPTTVFMTPDGTPIGRQPGYIKRPIFLQMLRYFGSGAYEEQSFEAFRSQASE
ncbi:thioredoxin family protein [Salinibacter grassmerensis]|uniref:thioredoxin family protein n=1 Tax=Salinibacter grassmerensis TaxID=3040353 RepID=UPI0021E83E42|nr:thioredoxin fold domain-containing protein [Salinibacter grassmerensis]